MHLFRAHGTFAVAQKHLCLSSQNVSRLTQSKRCGRLGEAFPIDNVTELQYSSKKWIFILVMRIGRVRKQLHALKETS